jgi:hypothetical protein
MNYFLPNLVALSVLLSACVEKQIVDTGTCGIPAIAIPQCAIYATTQLPMFSEERECMETFIEELDWQQQKLRIMNR